MNDLISRAAALDAIDGMKPMQGNMEQLVMKALCWAAVKSIPAVDAAPVVHGRWKLIDGQYSKWQCCSECGVAVPENAVHWCKASEDKNLNYCPHCGAKMGGDGDG